MSPLDTLLVSAIVGLVGGVVAMWRQSNALHDQWQTDQRESARLIFGLLQRIAVFRDEKPPATLSTAERPQFVEAKALAVKELNGEIEQMLRQFLDSEPPTKPGRKFFS